MLSYVLFMVTSAEFWAGCVAGLIGFSIGYLYGRKSRDKDNKDAQKQ